LKRLVLLYSACLSLFVCTCQYTFELDVPPAPTAASLNVLLSDIHINDKVSLTQNRLSIIFPRGTSPAQVQLSNVLTGVTADGTSSVSSTLGFENHMMTAAG
jgi:hypothetical protein